MPYEDAEVGPIGSHFLDAQYVDMELNYATTLHIDMSSEDNSEAAQAEHDRVFQDLVTFIHEYGYFKGPNGTVVTGRKPWDGVQIVTPVVDESPAESAGDVSPGESA